MLLPYTTLEYYGPGAAAVVEVSVPVVGAAIKGTGRAVAAVQGSGVISAAHVTGLKNSPMTVAGLGQIIQAYPRGKARPTMTVSIGSRPSAEDIAQAVWGAIASALNFPGTMGEKMNNGGDTIDPAAIASAVWDNATVYPACSKGAHLEALKVNSALLPMVAARLVRS